MAVPEATQYHTPVPESYENKGTLPQKYGIENYVQSAGTDYQEKHRYHTPMPRVRQHPNNIRDRRLDTSSSRQRHQYHNMQGGDNADSENRPVSAGKRDTMQDQCQHSDGSAQKQNVDDDYGQDGGDPQYQAMEEDDYYDDNDFGESEEYKHESLIFKLKHSKTKNLWLKICGLIATGVLVIVLDIMWMRGII